MTETIYRLQGATKCYGAREVCRIDSLEIRRGEILGIMGPSGAGKSTLLRLLNFLEPPTSGSITFKGQALNGSTRPPLALRRKVAMVFQEPVLLSTTVEGNVAYGLSIRGEREIKRRVSEAIKLVGLEQLTHAQARTLSGGEAQRAALARAMVIEPEVLLLDEPTANLDPHNVALIEGLISAFNRERGTTIVLVTHNVFQARRLAHRALLLLEGRVIEVGDAAQVFTNPADPRTAAFIRGDMIY